MAGQSNNPADHSPGQSFVETYVRLTDDIKGPQTPRRARRHVPDIRSVHVTDDTGNVHIQITIPAQVAQEVDLSFQMSPRRREQSPAVSIPSPLPLNLPDIGALNIGREDRHNSPSHRLEQPRSRILPERRQHTTPLNVEHQNVERQEDLNPRPQRQANHSRRQLSPPPSPPPSPIPLRSPSPSGTSSSLLYPAIPLPRVPITAPPTVSAIPEFNFLP